LLNGDCLNVGLPIHSTIPSWPCYYSWVSQHTEDVAMNTHHFTHSHCPWTVFPDKGVTDTRYLQVPTLKLTGYIQYTLWKPGWPIALKFKLIIALKFTL